MKKKIESIFSNRNLKLTSLRNDVLTIVLKAAQPLGAYEILDKLKKIRTGAEPPTVYRVLDFLMTNHLVHKIDSKNTYIPCAQMTSLSKLHKSILVICDNCDSSLEYVDPAFLNSVDKFARKHAIKINDSLLKLNGLCEECQ